MLAQHDRTLAVAESCTGGLLANRITNVPGASVVFLAGYVCYANHAKVDMLNLDPQLIEKHGAVSERVARALRWGLVPTWAKDAKVGNRMINARSETAGEKPAYRTLLANADRRALLIADGFYEWRRTKSGGKQPHFFTRADGAPMAFAGLAERWRDKNLPPDAPVIRSCTIITTTATATLIKHPGK